MNITTPSIFASRRGAAVALMAALILAGAGRAPAEEIYFDTISTRRASRDHGPYFGVFGGGAAANQADISSKIVGPGISGSNQSMEGDGWLIGVEFGYSFNSPIPLRPAVELELMYLNTAFNLPKLTSDSGSSVRYRSDVQAVTGMINGMLQLDLTNQRDDFGNVVAAIRPYIGAGIGGAYVRNTNRVETTSTPVPRGAAIKDADTLGDESDFSVAYQIFGGVEFAVSDTVSLYGEYKRLVLKEVGGESATSAKFDLWNVGVKVQY